MAITLTRNLFKILRKHRIQRRLPTDLRLHDAHLLNDIGLRWEHGQLVSIHGVEEAAARTQRHQADTRNAYETCPHCGSRLT